jgi:glycerophosphoryl diester phosphodiesterase
MAAFRKAIDAGADGIEFDVRLSRDAVPVVIHDDTLRRTASRPERVEDLSADELRILNVGSWFSTARGFTSDDYRAETIPTLEQLLDDFTSNNALLYLELKCEPRDVSKLASVTCNLLADHPVRDRVIVECFDLSAIQEVKRLDPEIKTAALFEPNLRDPGSLLSGRGLVDRAKTAAADQIALHYRLANRKTIEAARESGLKVVVWTVDEPNWLTRARDYGIDALITNDPALLVSQRNNARRV